MNSQQQIVRSYIKKLQMLNLYNCVTRVSNASNNLAEVPKRPTFLPGRDFCPVGALGSGSTSFRILLSSTPRCSSTARSARSFVARSWDCTLKIVSAIKGPTKKRNQRQDKLKSQNYAVFSSFLNLKL